MVERLSGWIEWKGGECPVDRYAPVEIKLRSGERGGSNWLACMCDWRHLPDDASQDIVAYRIVEGAA